MIHVRVLPEVLREGIQNIGEDALVFLLTREGSLLGSYGSRLPTSLHLNVSANTNSSIVSSLWNEYIKIGVSLNQQNIDYIIVMMENAQMAIGNAGNDYIVCIVTSSIISIGLLKQKIQHLSEYLQDNMKLLK